jgi:hypothetical protein
MFLRDNKLEWNLQLILLVKVWHLVRFVPLEQPSADSDSSSDLSTPVHPPSMLLPVITIKDKALDLGLKDITDKDSWTEAKKIIDTRLRRHPYCPGPDSKLLETSKSNTVASAWWEEVINYYAKPPISDLFVKESRFNGKEIQSDQTHQ